MYLHTGCVCVCGEREQNRKREIKRDWGWGETEGSMGIVFLGALERDGILH